MALKIFDSLAFGVRPVSSRNAMSPRLRWPRISFGRSLPRTTMRSTVDQPRYDLSFLRGIYVGKFECAPQRTCLVVRFARRYVIISPRATPRCFWMFLRELVYLRQTSLSEGLASARVRTTKQGAEQWAKRARLLQRRRG